MGVRIGGSSVCSRTVLPFFLVAGLDWADSWATPLLVAARLASGCRPPARVCSAGAAPCSLATRVTLTCCFACLLLSHYCWRFRRRRPPRVWQLGPTAGRCDGVLPLPCGGPLRCPASWPSGRCATSALPLPPSFSVSSIARCCVRRATTRCIRCRRLRRGWGGERTAGAAAAATVGVAAAEGQRQTLLRRQRRRLPLRRPASQTAPTQARRRQSGRPLP